jgi:cytochrome b561
MEQKYSDAARVLHWLIAACVLTLVLLGLILKLDSAHDALRDRIDFVHISLGLTVLVLMVARLAVRLASPPPAPSAAIPPMEQRLALAGHRAFYVLLFAQPVFGIMFEQAHGSKLSWFGLWHLPQIIGKNSAVHDWFAFLHFWGGMALIALILLHVGAVIWHHRQGTPVLQRMWG